MEFFFHLFVITFNVILKHLICKMEAYFKDLQ